MASLFSNPFRDVKPEAKDTFRSLVGSTLRDRENSRVTDTILNQQGQNVICVYVAIGQKNIFCRPGSKYFTRKGGDGREQAKKFAAARYPSTVLCESSLALCPPV